MNIRKHNKRALRDIAVQFTSIGVLLYRIPTAALLVAGALAAYLTLGQGTALASHIVIVVDSTADTNTADSVLTLREAILLMNGGVGGDGVQTGLGRGLEEEELDNLTGVPGAASADVVTFSDLAFPAENPGVISLGNTLPTLTAGGDTVNGLSRGVRIEGGGVDTFTCIKIGSDFNQVKGLQVTDCVVGVLINGNGAFSTVGPGNTVFGNSTGIWVTGHDNEISGNKIGTTVDGADIHPDGGNSNVGINVMGPNNVIGGSYSAVRNIISGNGTGIDLQLNAVGTNIQGNYIGTDVTGTLDRGNTGAGVIIRDDSNTVGGTGAGDGNVISGNGTDGVWVNGGAATGNSVLGNYIGTDAAGTAPIENWQHGVSIQEGTGNHVGGTVAGAGNLISGNNNMGVRITGAGNFVEGNLIGTTASGTSPLGNGNQGVRVDSAANNTIAGNVIADSGDAGIRTDGTTPGTVIKKNFIGTDFTGTIDLGNSQEGVYIDSNSVTVGGVSPPDGNVIAFNTGDGVSVMAYSSNVVSSNTIRDNAGSGVGIWGGTGHQVRRNAIKNNDLLGIDIAALPEDAFGITANDAAPDSDSGPNNMQNFPVLTSVYVDTALNTTTIDGNIVSAFSTFYQLDFFYSFGCDASGYGEGEVYLASGGVMTNASGSGFFSQQFDVEIPAGTFITATATDPNGNTSEFSNCFSAFPDGDADNDGYADVDEGMIGTNANDPCGGDGWPSDVFSSGLSANKLDVQDILSFVAPVRRLDTSPAFGGNYSVRWDLAPGANAPFPHHISIFDVTTMLNGAANSPAYPPMLGGARAFGKDCPYPP